MTDKEKENPTEKILYSKEYKIKGNIIGILVDCQYKENKNIRVIFLKYALEFELKIGDCDIIACRLVMNCG